MSEDRQGRNTGDSNKILYCSFCGKSQHEVRKLIAGPTVFICDECVELCMDIIREEHKTSLVKSKEGVPSPKEIKGDAFFAHLLRLAALSIQQTQGGAAFTERKPVAAQAVVAYALQVIQRTISVGDDHAPVD